jgi:hypothetical protein
VAQIAQIDRHVTHTDFRRYTARIDDHAFDMFWLHHPSYRSLPWIRAHGLLLGSLREHPIRAGSQRC